MSNDEYVKLWEKDITIKKRVNHNNLKRMTDADYVKLWKGKTPN
jgi:hypothetical protein